MRYYHLLFITMCHIRPLSFLLIILGTEIFFMCKILFVTLYRITWVRVRVRIRIGYYKAMYIICTRIKLYFFHQGSNSSSWLFLQGQWIFLNGIIGHFPLFLLDLFWFRRRNFLISYGVERLSLIRIIRIWACTLVI